MTTLTQERLREVLFYAPETGVFTWLQPASNRVQRGEPAGSLTSYGYLSIRVDRKAYQAHRLAWLYVHGEWPAGDIDHINSIRADNRIANLRDVHQSINRQNIRRAKCTSKTGILGVAQDRHRIKWSASITVAGKRRWLGSFATSTEAEAAYLAAKRNLHAGCTL